MSLGKAKTRIKEGVKELQTVQGMKRVAVRVGIGYAVGTIVDLILCYIFTNFVYPAVKDPETGAIPRFEGFSIFPNSYYTDAAGNNVYYMHYDDLLLLIVTVILLFTKKLWFVVGFFMGWYFSSYMNLYGALEPIWKPEAGA